MSVNSKMTAINDKIRSLLGITGKMGLDAMATNLGTVQNNVDSQANLIAQIEEALDGKAAGGNAGKPTQFTNLYDGATIHFKKAVNGSSSGITYSDDNYVNSILVPYHHKAGEPVVLRMRGIGTVRDRMGCGTLKEDGVTRVNHYQLNSANYFTQSYDEYGDATITFKGAPFNVEWYYFVFGFQYIGINSGVTEAKEGPIITINEPIGNGGYVG